MYLTGLPKPNPRFGKHLFLVLMNHATNSNVEIDSFAFVPKFPVVFQGLRKYIIKNRIRKIGRYYCSILNYLFLIKKRFDVFLEKATLFHCLPFGVYFGSFPACHFKIFKLQILAFFIVVLLKRLINMLRHCYIRSNDVVF